MGDKITALQQLVSPYGKVNTSDFWDIFCAYMFLLLHCERISVSESDTPADRYCIGAPRGSHLHQAPAPADPGEQIPHDEFGRVNLIGPVKDLQLIFFKEKKTDLQLLTVFYPSVYTFLADSHGLLP